MSEENLNTEGTDNVESTESVASVEKTGKKKRKKRKKRSVFGRIFTIFFTLLGIVLLTSGGSLLYLYNTQPEEAEKLVHKIKLNVIDKPVSAVKEEVFETYPTVYFNGHGGDWELDTADWGDWVLMDSYARVPDLLPVWALHNTYGGDQILGWEKGQKFNVEGEGKDGVYVVVDTREVYKWGLVNQIEGMQGYLALQTCYYGEDVIKFVSAVPLDVYEAGWPPPVCTDKEELIDNKCVPLPEPQSDEQPQSEDKDIEIKLEGTTQKEK